jgi:hypothetical protein
MQKRVDFLPGGTIYYLATLENSQIDICFALVTMNRNKEREANFGESSTSLERRVKDDNYPTKTI